MPQPPPPPPAGVPALGDRCRIAAGCGVYQPTWINPTGTTRINADQIGPGTARFPQQGVVDLRPINGQITTARVNVVHGNDGGIPVVHFIADPNGASQFVYIRYCVPGSNPPQCIEGWTDVNNLAV